jgi:hypothetical protein
MCKTSILNTGSMCFSGIKLTEDSESSPEAFIENQSHLEFKVSKTLSQQAYSSQQLRVLYSGI